MPLDAICLEAVVNELRGLLAGGRVDKVFQPERDEVGLAVRTPASGNIRLLISANPSNCRIHITRKTRENPAVPPMFCMLLRKHMTGARITGLTQPPRERAVILELDASNELGERVKRTLIAELIGRHSNIILADEHERVIDCMKRVDLKMSEQRPVLPGLFYRLPPGQDKADPRDPEAWRARLELAPPTEPADKWICGNMAGVSPVVARELCFRAFGQTSPRFEELRELEPLMGVISGFTELLRRGDFSPFLLRDGARPKEFSYMPIRQYGELYSEHGAHDFSELLDAFFTERDMLEHRQRNASNLRKTAQNALDRARRKMALQNDELEAAQNRERLREFGDLLTANFHTIRRGDHKAVVTDFFSPEPRDIEIPLDERLSPQQNAEYYYKQYKKSKHAQIILQEHINKGKIEIQYLESVLDALERVSGDADISELRDELAAGGYIKVTAKRAAPKYTRFEPLKFKSTSGLSIYVGRNNRQNDTLTLKTADKNDIWLHVQKIPGSHVIIDCGGAPPDYEALEQAAIIAAVYSQARGGVKIPVDYTQVKYVKKMAGGKPGMVIYDKFKTLTVDPDMELADKLRT